MISTELKKRLDDARYCIDNDVYKREEFAARFHHRLVKIHPFPNGNGRHARIMTDVILERMLKVKAIDWGVQLYEEGLHRKTYIDALRLADKNEYAALIDFVSR